MGLEIVCVLFIDLYEKDCLRNVNFVAAYSIGND